VFVFSDATVKVYLRRAWKIPASVIDYFLKTWFAVTPQLMKTVQNLTKNLIATSENQPTQTQRNRNLIPNCSKYKSCSKINFHTWYAAIFASLAQHVHKLVINSS